MTQGLLNTRDKVWLMLELLPGTPKTEAGRAKVEAAARRCRQVASRSYVKRLPALALALVGMGLGTQVGATDGAALAQRPVLQVVKEIFEELDRNKNTVFKLAQEASNGYKMYKTANALYQRIHSGNVGLTVSFTLPPVELVGPNMGGSVDSIVIRPVSGNYRPGQADLGAFSGMLNQHGVTIDYDGLVNQLAGLAEGNWDFDNFRTVYDAQGHVVHRIDLNEAQLKAKQDAVGAFLIAGRVFSDTKFANKYFAANGANSTTGGLKSIDYNKLASVSQAAMVQNADALDIQANAMDSASQTGRGVPSVHAVFTRAAAKGIREMASEYEAGSPGGDIDVRLAKQSDAKRLMAVENMGKARMEIDMAVDNAAKGTEHAKQIKTWYDVTKSGQLNVWDFFMTSMSPSGTADTSNHGQVGETQKTNANLNTVIDQMTLLGRTVNAQEANHQAEKAFDQGTDQELRRQAVTAQATMAESGVHMATAMQVLAEGGAKFTTPVPVVVYGDSPSSFTIDACSGEADGYSAEQSQAELDSAIQGAASRSLKEFQGVFSGLDEGWGVFKPLIDAIQSAGMTLFGDAFSNPSPDSDQA